LARKLAHICSSKETKSHHGIVDGVKVEEDEIKKKVKKLVYDYVKKMEQEKKPPFDV
jgi:hypothetical protein